MKLRAGTHELPFTKPPKVVLLVTIPFILLTLISICHPFKYWQPNTYLKSITLSSVNNPDPPSSSSSSVSRVIVSGNNADTRTVVDAASAGECDIFSG
ncbi:hypothetical protein CRG98_009766, partial [Punica granatum]